MSEIVHFWVIFKKLTLPVPVIKRNWKVQLMWNAALLFFLTVSKFQPNRFSSFWENWVQVCKHVEICKFCRLLKMEAKFGADFRHNCSFCRKGAPHRIIITILHNLLLCSLLLYKLVLKIHASLWIQTFYKIAPLYNQPVG